MKQTFLHISDLHYRPDWPEESDLVLTKFTDDLKEQIKKFDRPFAVFSGDLVQAGGDANIYESFQLKVADELTNAGIPKEKRVVVSS